MSLLWLRMVGTHNTKSGGVIWKRTCWSTSCREEVRRNQWERFIFQSLPPADGHARIAALCSSHENDKFISTFPLRSWAKDSKSQRQGIIAELVLQDKIIFFVFAILKARVWILIRWPLRMHFLYLNKVCIRQSALGKDMWSYRTGSEAHSHSWSFGTPQTVAHPAAEITEQTVKKVSPKCQVHSKPADWQPLKA